MNEEWHSSQSSHFLTTVLSTSRSEHGDLRSVSLFHSHSLSCRELHLASPRSVTHKLPNHSPSSPETTALIKESRYLSWDPTVSTCQRIMIRCWKGLPGGGTNDNSINGLEVVWGDNWVFGFEGPRSVHLPKDLFGEGLSAGLSLLAILVKRDRRKRGKRCRRGDLQDIRPNLCSCRFDTFDDSLRKLLDMPVSRVEDYGDDWFGPLISLSLDW